MVQRVSAKLLTTVLALASYTTFAEAITTSDAEASFHTLQQWYNQSIGLWIPSTGWWNSANCLTVIADLAAIDQNVKREASYIWPETWRKAQVYNLDMQKVVAPNWLPHSYYAHHWPFFPPSWHHRPNPHQTNGFLNSYYDDEGWWALAWIAVCTCGAMIVDWDQYVNIAPRRYHG